MPNKTPRLFLAGVLRPLSGTILLSLVLTGCAPFRSGISEPLPPPSALPCCWQAQERVQVSTTDGEHTFLVALAADADALTVVVLDDLGRRLLTLIQDGDEIATRDAPRDWPKPLSRQLLLAVYLHYLQPERWAGLTGDWSVVEEGSSRTLQYQGRERIRLHYAAVGVTVATVPFARPRRIEFVGQNVQINVVTLSRDTLSEVLHQERATTGRTEESGSRGE